MRKFLILLICAICSVNLCFARYISQHKTLLPIEPKGFRVYGDFLLSFDGQDEVGKTTPVFGITGTAGGQFSHYFFLGLKTGTVIVPQDFCTVPLALNFRWTFGRNNILVIDKSAGVQWVKRETHMYKDCSLGGRIPLGERSLYVSIGYVIFPQQWWLEPEGVPEYTILGWIEPQLKISYNIFRK